MRAPCRVIVFAKAPIAGFAKTRLIPALGAEGAARLAERLLENAVQQACAAAIGPVELCCTPDAGHPVLVRLARRYGVDLAVQGEGDLGARMARALATPQRTLLVGSDIPGLDAAYLRAARQALDDHHAVFGPATDGGYVLIGLNAPAPALFEGIAWSTAHVMQQTRERLTSLGLRHYELAPLCDIDDTGDLGRLPREWLA